MTIFNGVVVFLMVWWVVLFAVLPWGVRQPDQPEPGHTPGAPAKPHLKLKFAVTTVISIVIWLIIYFVVTADLLSFRRWAETM